LTNIDGIPRKEDIDTANMEIDNVREDSESMESVFIILPITA
jgi:hypothetical protein